MFKSFWSGWFSTTVNQTGFTKTSPADRRPTAVIDVEVEDWQRIDLLKQPTYESDSTDSDSEYHRESKQPACKNGDGDTTDTDSGFLHESEKNGWSTDSEVDTLGIDEQISCQDDRIDSLSTNATPSTIIEFDLNIAERSKVETTELESNIYAANAGIENEITEIKVNEFACENSKQFPINKIEEFMLKAIYLKQIIHQCKGNIGVLWDLFYDIYYYVNATVLKNNGHEDSVQMYSSALDKLEKLKLMIVELKLKDVEANIKRLQNIIFRLQHLPKDDQITKKERFGGALNFLGEVDAVVINKEIELNDIVQRLENLRDRFHE